MAIPNGHRDEYGHWYGSKYQLGERKSRQDLKKLISADIRAAMKAGTLPGVRGFTIACPDRAIDAIDVRVDFSAPIHEVEHLRGIPHVRPGDRYRQQASNALSRIEDLANAYNYDRSDSMTDYFDRGFYDSVEPNRLQEDAERAVVEALCSPRRAAVQEALNGAIALFADWRQERGHRPPRLWNAQDAIRAEYPALLEPHDAAERAMLATPEDWDSARATDSAIVAAREVEVARRRKELLLHKQVNAVRSERAKRAAATRARRRVPKSIRDEFKYLLSVGEKADASRIVVPPEPQTLPAAEVGSILARTKAEGAAILDRLEAPPRPGQCRTDDGLHRSAEGALLCPGCSELLHCDGDGCEENRRRASDLVPPATLRLVADLEDERARAEMARLRKENTILRIGLGIKGGAP